MNEIKEFFGAITAGLKSLLNGLDIIARKVDDIVQSIEKGVVNIRAGKRPKKRPIAFFCSDKACLVLATAAGHG